MTSPDVVCESITPALDDLSRLFRALSDPVRLRILLLLSEEERNVTSLCAFTGLAQPTVSHHLGILRASSLAQGRRAGKSIFYSAGPRICVDEDGSISLQVGEVPGIGVRLRAKTTAAPKLAAQAWG